MWGLMLVELYLYLLDFYGFGFVLFVLCKRLPIRVSAWLDYVGVGTLVFVLGGVVLAGRIPG